MEALHWGLADTFRGLAHYRHGESMVTPMCWSNGQELHPDPQAIGEIGPGVGT